MKKYLEIFNVITIIIEGKVLILFELKSITIK